MTTRERRLHRLVELRSRQHDGTMIELCAANAILHEVELKLRQSVEEHGLARDNMVLMLTQDDQEGWLLACAADRVSNLSIHNEEERRVDAASAVETVSQREANARRERRQMELTLEHTSKAREAIDARAEQQQMDELTRHVRAASSSSFRSDRFC
jgi:flagellar biosynthesis chaperone FliJ